MSHLPGPADMLPVLSRGKHRNPRKGGCFMEMASYLAGERWSDHPACTHPLLAALARYVNDCTSDTARPQLAPLIPSVIGLTSTDPRVDVAIATRCATTALPYGSQGRQNVLAVGLLTCDRVLAEIDGHPAGWSSQSTRAALESTPSAAQWARRFSGRAGVSLKGFRKHAAPGIVRTSVEAIALSTSADPDTALRALLNDAVQDCVALVHAPEPAVDDARWEEACRLLESRR